jgi:hypothetical protein
MEQRKSPNAVDAMPRRRVGFENEEARRFASRKTYVGFRPPFPISFGLRETVGGAPVLPLWFFERQLCLVPGGTGKTH